MGGDKLWGSGSGVESINGGNVGYDNSGMYAARGRCGGSSCALIVNPPGHRHAAFFKGMELGHRFGGVLVAPTRNVI